MLPGDVLLVTGEGKLSSSLVAMQKFIYPQTLHYSSNGNGYPFFVKAAQHKHFKKLSTITGIESADDLREKVKEGHERLRTAQWHNFYFERNFWSSMNMDELDKLK